MHVQSHVCTGGIHFGADIRKLDYGQQILSGTPDIVFDMIRRKMLRTWCIKMLVLDGADELLKQFKDIIFDVHRYLPCRPIQGVYNNVTWLRNFKGVLKCKIFAQELTCSKEIV